MQTHLAAVLTATLLAGAIACQKTSPTPVAIGDLTGHFSFRIDGMRRINGAL